jgi:ionotropic glutamate receptor
LQEFDAVVGDATITKKRLDLVDFTQPYIESGLEIVVPLISRRPNNEWAFLQPFTPTLWITIGAFFLFTGLVVWMLEHKTNYAFRGRFRKQIFTSLWSVASDTCFFPLQNLKHFLEFNVEVACLLC